MMTMCYWWFYNFGKNEVTWSKVKVMIKVVKKGGCRLFVTTPVEFCLVSVSVLFSEPL